MTNKDVLDCVNYIQQLAKSRDFKVEQVELAQRWLRQHARHIASPLAIDELAGILQIPVSKGWFK